MAAKGSKRSEEFGYLNIPADIEIPDSTEISLWPKQETFSEKALRKLKENPFIPIGLGVTVFALTYGIVQMGRGNTVMSQKMMRLRVGAQGFTVFAILGGVLYESNRKTKAKTIPLN